MRIPPSSRGARRSGFTIIELLVVMIMVGVIATLSVGRISSFIVQSNVARAAQSIKNDLQSAFQLAARNRQPVRLTWNSSTMTFSITNRAQTQTFRRVGLGTTSGYNLRAANVSVYPSSGYIEVFPNGLATDSFTVRISKGGFSKRIRMTRAGLVTTR
ncbi:MAG TPA: type II secretion system protein [Gemmatimonadaceae bacterium]|jgi:type II secretion system protein H|nr:type II secretion system protein [Gemmatimonadaceae bacterium]